MSGFSEFTAVHHEQETHHREVSNLEGCRHKVVLDTLNTDNLHYTMASTLLYMCGITPTRMLHTDTRTPVLPGTE